jgi:hypothetical protein
MFTQARAQKLQRGMRLDATLIRVPIGYVFIEIVTKLKTCHIYKAVLQTV